MLLGLQLSRSSSRLLRMRMCWATPHFVKQTTQKPCSLQNDKNTPLLHGQSLQNQFEVQFRKHLLFYTLLYHLFSPPSDIGSFRNHRAFWLRRFNTTDCCLKSTGRLQRPHAGWEKGLRGVEKGRQRLKWAVGVHRLRHS